MKGEGEERFLTSSFCPVDLEAHALPLRNSWLAKAANVNLLQVTFKNIT
jgi:hypothetical protein